MCVSSFDILLFLCFVVGSAVYAIKKSVPCCLFVCFCFLFLKSY